MEKKPKKHLQRKKFWKREKASPEIPLPETKQLRVVDNPFEGTPAVSSKTRAGRKLTQRLQKNVELEKVTITFHWSALLIPREQQMLIA